MTWREKINTDFKESFRAKDQDRVATLRLLLAAIKEHELRKRTKLSKTETDIGKLEKESQLNEEEVMVTIAAEAKKRQDAIKQYQIGGRQELVDQEERELKILSGYLPQPISEEEIRKLVKGAVATSGATDIKEIGKVMAILMPQVKGRADGGVVQRIVKEEFEK